MRLGRGNLDFRCFAPHTRVQAFCDSGLPPLTLGTRGFFSRAASPRDRPKADHRRRVIIKVALKSRRPEPKTTQEKPLAPRVAFANFKRKNDCMVSYCIAVLPGFFQTCSCCFWIPPGVDPRCLLALQKY